MVSLADLLHLSSILAFETKQTWSRKLSGGPHYHTSMSMILSLMIIQIITIKIIMLMPVCIPVSSLSQTDWESGWAGSVWLTMKLCTMTRTSYGKRVRTHTHTHSYSITKDLKGFWILENGFWIKMFIFFSPFLLLQISLHSMNVDSY